MQIMETRKARHEALSQCTSIESNLKETEMNLNKAQEVEQVYDTASWVDNIHKEGGYALAVDAAQNLGGIEIYNSNSNGGSSISSEPVRTFEFDDSSAAQVMWGGVFVIVPNQTY